MVAVTTHMELLTKWICLGDTVIRAKGYCAEENTSFYLSREDLTQGPEGDPELIPWTPQLLSFCHRVLAWPSQG